MGDFELLTQADYVLDACGREVAPPGFRFVDLPRIIPFHVALAGTPGTANWVDEAGAGIVITGLVPGVQVVTPDANNPIPVPLVVTVSGTTITITGISNTGSTHNWLDVFNALNIPAVLALVTLAPVGLNTNAAFVPCPPLVGTVTNPLPTQALVSNNEKTLFLVMGIVFVLNGTQVRIKWPSGRFLAQNLSGAGQLYDAFFNLLGFTDTGFPAGTGGNMIKLKDPVPIESGAQITVEVSGHPTSLAVDIQFWGKLRYLLKDTRGDRSGVGRAAVDGETCIIGYPAAAQSVKRANCVVGYPVQAFQGEKPGGGVFQFQTMPDPIDYLDNLDRYVCGPDQNVMAPEFRMGNQCCAETPDGEQDDSFTFLSPAIVVPIGSSVYGTAVLIPGAHDVVIKRWRVISTWQEEAGFTGAVPMVAMRLPNGYSITGGDMIPVDLLWWVPMFPTLRVGKGTRIIIDVSNLVGIGGLGSGTITSVIEFDAVRRSPAQ